MNRKCLPTQLGDVMSSRHCLQQRSYTRVKLLYNKYIDYTCNTKYSDKYYIGHYCGILSRKHIAIRGFLFYLLYNYIVLYIYSICIHYLFIL